MSFLDSLLGLFQRVGYKLFSSKELEEFYEQRYLYYRAQLLTRKSVYLTYNTGRVGTKREDPRKILRYYNDLKTKPSEETISEARDFFNALVSDVPDGLEHEHEKVKKIAFWINTTAVYETDSSRWGKSEYWSSPFDLWQEYKETGKFRDDCDGWAALMWWACTLVGIPSERLWVWAGNADNNGKDYGHANLLYDSTYHGQVFHIEGSFKWISNQRYWLKYPMGCKRYPETWFYFSDSRIVRREKE